MRRQRKMAPPMRSWKSRKILSIICMIVVLIVSFGTAIGEISAYSGSDEPVFENVLEEQSEQTLEIQLDENVDEGVEEETVDIAEDAGESADVIYTPQPATKEEVQAAITLYEKEYREALELLGFNAALEVMKPHWEFEVEENLMPEGYNCQLVDWDDSFKGNYYTFFPNPAAMANTYNIAYKATPPPGDGIVNISDLFTCIQYAGTDANNSNIAVIANDASKKYGAMWSNEKLNLALPFETQMSLYLHHRSGGSSSNTDLGDGMTFTLHNDKRGLQAIGSDGEGLGVYGSTYYLEYDKNNPNKNPVSVIENSLAIEFDLYENSYTNQGTADHYMQDPTYGSTYGHCALLYPPYPLKEVRILSSDHKNAFRFTKQATWYPFQVKWEPKISAGGIVGGKLTYTFNGTTNYVEIADVTKVFGSTKVYWGFTGSTGGYTSVLAAAITAFPTPQDAMNVTKKVEDTNGQDIDHKYANEGDILRYRIKVTAEKANVGPISITDELSQYVEYAGGNVTITTSDTSNPSFTVIPVFSGSALTVNTGHTLKDVKDWLEISFDVKVKEGSAGNIVYNTAQASVTDLTDPFLSNTTDVTIVARSGKRVTDNSEAGVNGTTVTVGDEITYEIFYVNNTGSKADLTITDNLAAGVEYVSHTGVNTVEGDYNQADDQVIWQINDVEAGAGGSVTITVKVTKDIDRDKNLENKAILQWSTSPTPEEPSVGNPVEGYKVTYDGNGGAALTGDTTHTYGLYPTGDDHTVRGNDEEGFEREGYTFTGWNSESNGSGNAYQPGSIITAVTEDIVLYAQWTANAEFEFNKVDKNTTIGLRDAVFTLYKYNSDTNSSPAADAVVTDSDIASGKWILSGTAASGTNGRVTFSDLTAGYYQLVEANEPEGYERATVQWRLYVEADDASYKVISISTIKKDPDYSVGYDFEKNESISEYSDHILPNKKNAEFIFTKVQEDGSSVLAGAEFELYSWEGTGTIPDLVDDSAIPGQWKSVDTQTSGEDGEVCFEALDRTTYQLVETKAPKGYSRPVGQWRIILNASGEWEILGKGSILPPAFLKAEDGSLAVTNFKDPYFPLTGFGGIKYYLILGSGVMLSVVIFFLFSRKRKIQIPM